MASYLIQYVDPSCINGHEDPNLDEFTYGDYNNNGRILRDKVNEGDFLFFHTRIRGKRCITAYFDVSKTISINEARKSQLIMMKYKNPHLFGGVSDDGYMVFGDSITSQKLKKPLELTIDILNNLSRKPNLNPWASPD